MRATTPLQPLEYLGSPVAIPQPMYTVGTIIDISKLNADSYAYYAKKVLREILRDTQKMVYALKAEGYMKGMIGKKMLDHNKAQIRQKITVMQNAHTIELAGFAPWAMHVVGTVGNECYLKNGQCHSGLSYKCYLLFRCNIDGHEAVYVHDYPIVGEAYIEELLMPQLKAA